MPDYQQPLPSIQVTSPYGAVRPNEVHQGVDLAASDGTPITNMADGTVVSTTTASSGSTAGNSVTMDYGDGVTAQFMHMNSVPQTVDSNGNLVPLTPGMSVSAGSTLGNVGNTGASRGAHLHLQMAQDGVTFDPMEAILNSVQPPSPSQSTQTSTPTQLFVVPAQDQSQISRSLDSSAPSDWTLAYDPHQSYYAAAEFIFGGVTICPFTPSPVTQTPGNLGQQNDTETQGGKNDLRLEEFQFNSVATRGSGNRIMLTLFVKSWTDVIQLAALTEQKSEATIRFGYLNVPGGLIGPINCNVLSIIPEFIENGYRVSIECIDHDSFVNLNAGAKNITWKSASGRISDIVYYIAKQNGWRTCIEPTVAVDPSVPYLQNQQNDLSFFNTTLASKARSAEARKTIMTEGGTGYGPYVAYLTSPDPNDTVKSSVLHFHPHLPSTHNVQSSTPSREYVWGGLQDAASRTFGTVVSFNPEFQNTKAAMLGGSTLQETSMDPTQKILNGVVAYGTDFQDGQVAQNEGPVNVNMSSKNPSRSEHQHEHEMEFLKSKAAARFFKMREYAFSASMTVLGDPYVCGGIVVNVLVVRPNDGSIMMYDWYVQESTHQIQGGEYVINMTLKRTSVGPIAIKGKDASLTGLGVGMAQYNQQTWIEPSVDGLAVGQMNSNLTQLLQSVPTPPTTSVQ